MSSLRPSLQPHQTVEVFQMNLKLAFNQIKLALMTHRFISIVSFYLQIFCKCLKLKHNFTFRIPSFLELFLKKPNFCPLNKNTTELREMLKLLR